MDLEDKKPKELATIIAYFMDDKNPSVHLGYNALARLLDLAEGESAEVLPIREDGTVLHELPRAREGGFTIPKVSRPFDHERDLPEGEEV